MFIERTVIKWVYYNEGRKSDYFPSPSHNRRPQQGLGQFAVHSNNTRRWCAYLYSVFIVVVGEFFFQEEIAEEVGEE